MMTSAESNHALVNIAETCQLVKAVCEGRYDAMPSAYLADYVKILQLKRSRWLRRTNHGGNEQGLPPTVSALWDNLQLQLLDLSIEMGRAHLRELRKQEVERCNQKAVIL